MTKDNQFGNEGQRPPPLPGLRPRIVVLTPLKNDAWILPPFLAATSVFADLIIIADQGSTDGGPEICRSFEKVYLVENPSAEYDEASRQELLIATARRLVPAPRILMALDTDEILTAGSLNSPGWHRMLTAPPGTTVYFEKPNLFLSPSCVERRDLDFPGAFIDDDVTAHSASRVHSPRVPLRKDGDKLVLKDVKVMHYALVRPEAQKAKIRMYAALENLMGTKSLYWRRRYYWAPKVVRATGPVEPTPPDWLQGWSNRGIDVTTIKDSEPYWQDLALLDLFIKHGCRRFWFDDVWRKDWKSFAREYKPEARIHPPPILLRMAIDALQWVVELLAAMRKTLRGG